MKFLDDLPRYVFFTGKGGVGKKTSIACATAVHLADGGARVLLVTTDPASNVGQVFGLPIGNRVTPVPEVPRLSALEIDPEAAAQGYRDRIVGPVRGVLRPLRPRWPRPSRDGDCRSTSPRPIRRRTWRRRWPRRWSTCASAASTRASRPNATGSACWRRRGATLDADGRAMLEEDLRSPCTEEIAVFQAFAHIIREARQSFVVMDTAPTGHTLLLLDATGAYHREVIRQMSGRGMHVRTPLMQLQDPQQTKVIIVTLAETTPVLEAAGLQADLRRAGIEPWAWVINQSLAVAPTTSALLQQRAANERARIQDVATKHARRYAVVGLHPVEPVGAERLAALAGAQASGVSA